MTNSTITDFNIWDIFSWADIMNNIIAFFSLPLAFLFWIFRADGGGGIYWLTLILSFYPILLILIECFFIMISIIFGGSNEGGIMGTFVGLNYKTLKAICGFFQYTIDLFLRIMYVVAEAVPF